MTAKITDINAYREQKQSKAIRKEMRYYGEQYLYSTQLTQQPVADPDIITNMSPEELAAIMDEV